jgi:putative membrane protein
MKSKTKFISLFSVLVGTFFAAGTLWAQGIGGGDYYNTQPDNPYFRKKAVTPQPNAAAATTTKLSAKDKNFLNNAASSGGWEVQTGKLAEKRAQSDTTKNVAARMVADHSKASNEVIDLAKKKGLGMSIDGVKAQQIGGANFDKQYLNLLEQDHQEQVKLFEKEAKSGDDPDIKNWAAKTLPMLRQHLAMAKDVSSKVK